MAIAQKFRVNYFVGALLAQGGHVSLDDTRIIFSPTSAIDRAMGAKDVEIQIHHIRAVSYSGALSRTFKIKTDERIHKFEGGQTREFWEVLETVLRSKGMKPIEPVGTPTPNPPAAAISTTAFPCPQCRQLLQPSFNFCPYCGTPSKLAANRTL